MAIVPENKRVKRSVAVLVRNGDTILTIRRPNDDDEFPGIWGLPAGSYRMCESREEVVSRIGCDKLGVVLTTLGVLSRGRQDRTDYLLEMELVEAQMDGLPKCPEWCWESPWILEKGRQSGSLCCDLALRA